MRWRTLETDSGWITAAVICTIVAAFAFNHAVPGFLAVRDIDSLAGTAFAPLLLLTLSQMLLLRLHRLEPALIGVSTLVGTLSVYWNARDGVPFGYAVLLALAVVVIAFAVINGLLAASLTAPAALGVSMAVFISATVISNVVIGAQGVVSVPGNGEFARLEHENAAAFPPSRSSRSWSV